jgi:hypothetical protein
MTLPSLPSTQTKSASFLAQRTCRSSHRCRYRSTSLQNMRSSTRRNAWRSRGCTQNLEGGSVRPLSLFTPLFLLIISRLPERPRRDSHSPLHYSLPLHSSLRPHPRQDRRRARRSPERVSQAARMPSLPQDLLSRHSGSAGQHYSHRRTAGAVNDWDSVRLLFPLPSFPCSYG